MPGRRSAWETFQEEHSVPPGAVRPPILESWRRSRELDVAPDLRVARHAAPAWAHPADRAPEHEELFGLVGARVVRRLAGELIGSSCVLVLADAAGTVLTRAGDSEVTRRTDAAQMVPGAAWTEDAAGTNGLGLALALGRPAQVVADEHYCSGWHPYACTTTTIRHPLTGDLLGALDLTTPARIHNGPVAAALVRRAGQEIEAAMRERLAESPSGERSSLRDLERKAIMRALDDAGGQVELAAERLGISRATLYRRLRGYRALGRR